MQNILSTLSCPEGGGGMEFTNFATLSKIYLEIIWYDMSLSSKFDVSKATAF